MIAGKTHIVANNFTNVYEGLTVSQTPAPLFKRVLSYVTDMALLTSFGYIFIALIIIPTLFSFITFDPGGVTIVIVVATIVVAVLFAQHYYFVWFESRKGATPGKKMLGLKVVAKDGSPLTVKQCWIRELFRYIDCTLVIPGLLSTTISKHSQRLGDQVAATLVIYSAKAENEKNYLYLKADEYAEASSYVQFSDLPQDKRNQYLAFAYQSFVTKDRKPSFADTKHWLEAIESHMKIEETYELSDSDRLLIYAEYCHQYSISNDS